MTDFESHTITYEKLLCSVIRSMERVIVEVIGDMMRCTTVKVPRGVSVGNFWDSKGISLWFERLTSGWRWCGSRILLSESGTFAYNMTLFSTPLTLTKKWLRLAGFTRLIR